MAEIGEMTKTAPKGGARLRERPAAERFREAMSVFPSGVTVVTTGDSQGGWWGFTATSFCSLSLDPPLVLVCLAKDARCHGPFLAADAWVIHVLGAESEAVARRFATKNADKFAGAAFAENERGHPVLLEAGVVLECELYDRHDAGDHTILVGRVYETTINEMTPAVYFRRGFHTFTEYTEYTEGSVPA